MQPKRKMKNALTAYVVMAAMVLATLGASGNVLAYEPENGEQTRVQYTHIPVVDDCEVSAEEGCEYLDMRDTGLYVNDHTPAAEYENDTANLTVRLYGDRAVSHLDATDPLANDYVAGANSNRFDDPANVPANVYTDYLQAFSSDEIPGDSATWNPAIILSPSHADDFLGGDAEEYNDLYGHEITACGENAHLKKFLRQWYEPGHEYYGPRVDSLEFSPPTFGDAIQIESTYALLDADTYQPTGGCTEEGTAFPFPIYGIGGQPGVDGLETVNLLDVDVDGTESSIVLGYSPSFDGSEGGPGVPASSGAIIEFLDHAIRFEGLSSDGTDKQGAFTVWYTGNNWMDSRRLVHMGQGDALCFDRKNIASVVDPLDATSFTYTSSGDNPCTFFVQVNGLKQALFAGDSTTATFQVGKAIQAGDIFYVDGVRYDVPAVFGNNDGTAHDEFNYITLRTALPKSDGLEGSYTTVTKAYREDFVGDEWQVVDNSVVTTQWIREVDFGQPIPVDPPFSYPMYLQVDDTDVLMWQPTDNVGEFPYGPVEDNGLQRWTGGESFLTKADSLATPWGAHFDVDATIFQDAGTNYKQSTEARMELTSGINFGAWDTTCPTAVTNDDGAGFCAGNTTFYWNDEWFESRYSTNLLEILLNNTLDSEIDVDAELWSAYFVQTEADAYTQFVLPNRPNTASYAEGTIVVNDGDACTRGDLFGPDMSSSCSATYGLLGGDYNINTAHVLDQEYQAGPLQTQTRLNFAHIPVHSDDDGEEYFDVIAWDYNTETDLYINDWSASDAIAAFTGGELAHLDMDPADTTVRLYAHDVDYEAGDVGAYQGTTPANAPENIYDEYFDVLDPEAIPGYSATWNPALISHTDHDFTLYEHCASGYYADYPECQENNAQLFWMSGCGGEDVDLKKYLRTWYEPNHTLYGARYDAGTGEDATPSVVDAVMIESTYTLLDSDSLRPARGCEGDTKFPFPATGIWASGADYSDSGVYHQQFGVDAMMPVNLKTVDDGTQSLDTSVAGSITLETDPIVLCVDTTAQDDCPEGDGIHSNNFVQFWDFMVVLEDVDENGDIRARICYIGNTMTQCAPNTNTHLLTTGDAPTFFTRHSVANAGPANPQAGDGTYTWAIEVIGSSHSLFEGTPETATVLISKVFTAGDTVYVDGVRYDFPAIQVEDDEFRSITMRTPLPKGDSSPCSESTWTSERDPVNNTGTVGTDYGMNYCQIVDNSQVTTQWIMQYDWADPLPVDPPFSGYHYRQIDDTDVVLWQPGPDALADPDTFPQGPSFEPLTSSPSGTGMPIFPNGEEQATSLTPTKVFREFWDLQATGFGDDNSNNKFAMGLRSSIEPGVNHGAWDLLESTGAFAAETTDFYWTSEWAESRMSTVLVERPTLVSGTPINYGTYEQFEYDSQPSKYTSFVLPDRSNPASQYTTTLEFAAGGACSRGDLFPVLTECEYDYLVGGGDFLITSTLLLSDFDEAVFPGYNAFDANQNCSIEMSEAFAAVDEYRTNPLFSISELFFVINLYKYSPYIIHDDC